MPKLLFVLFLLLAAPAAAQQSKPFTQADIEAMAKVYQASPDLRAASGCVTGDGAACTAFGQALMLGTLDTPQDQPRAVRNFTQACNLGHAPGCNYLGAALQAGRGAPVNLPEARVAYTKACEGGNLTGCVGIGRMHLRGQGGATDVAKGLGYLNIACDEKVGAACATLGQHYAGSSATPNDPAKAGLFYGRACAMGQKVSCVERDRMALFSAPAPQIKVEEVTAATALNAQRPDLKAQAACAAKNGEACTQLGLMQMNGAANVKQDPTAAVSSFGQACALANGPGCRALGMALQSGRGATIDLPQAQAAYLKACAAKDGGGCGRAGAMYASGQGGAKDFAQGVAYFTRGCDLRDGTSCNALGGFYATTAPTDPAKAALLFGKACELGYAVGCTNRDRLAAGVAR